MKPVEIPPVEEPRERKPEQASVKTPEPKPAVTRPERPAHRPQAQTANTQGSNILDGLRPYLGAYVNFDDKQDVSKKALLAVLALVVAFNVLRLVF